ncbi:hypothetical protein INR49_015174 [Caranx melampygus]|nr:hypothetical protein INR49_015174 [Caranx melampygus]
MDSNRQLRTGCRSWKKPKMLLHTTLSFLSAVGLSTGRLSTEREKNTQVHLRLEAVAAINHDIAETVVVPFRSVRTDSPGFDTYSSKRTYKLDMRCAHTCTVADAFVFDYVFMLERFEDFNFPLKVPEVLGRAVL